MTKTDRTAAVIVAVVGALLLIVPTTRGFIVELATIVGVIIWLGMLVAWNVITSLGWTIVVGVIMGLTFTAFAVIDERNRLGGKDDE